MVLYSELENEGLSAFGSTFQNIGIKQTRINLKYSSKTPREKFNTHSNLCGIGECKPIENSYI